MPQSDLDLKLPPFDQVKGVRRLAASRRGAASDHARHHLFAAQDKRSGASVLIKLTSKPGLVYQQNLANEIASLTTINRELPDSRYFPVVKAHGSLRDGRAYLISSLFDELPLAATIGTERRPDKMVTHLRTTLEVASALTELHRLPIFHVDLNPMNILHRTEKGRPIIRIVDFESSYDRSRHSTGVFYDPPTTPGYSAPELTHQPPDARADLFSLGAVLYTMIAGFGWTWESEVAAAVDADTELDAELKRIVRMSVHTNPEKRQASIDVFRSALAAYLEGIWPGRSW
ncbi:MAG: protein kinase [Vicinamibacterales bacterium]